MVFRIRKSKDRHYNDQTEKDTTTNNDLQNIGVDESFMFLINGKTSSKEYPNLLRLY